MFVMAPFAAGLLLYWVTSNILNCGRSKATSIPSTRS